MTPKALRVPAVEVRVDLRDIDPPVWRRLVLPGHWNLSTVHDAIQLSFGWYDDHLHLFEVGDRRFGAAGPYGPEVAESETVVRVHEILQRPGDVMTYWYDFGDDWYHDIVVEKVLDAQKEARCLDGERAGPPEDSGGPWGYQDKLAVLAEPDNDERADVIEWFGMEFDPELVDIEGIDAALRRFS